MTAHPMHVLTPMTGREAAETRTVIVGTVELNRRLAAIIGVSAVPSLLATLVLWPFFGTTSVLAFPVVIGIAVLLFYRRSSKGMRLHTYQQLVDRRRGREHTDVFYLCGQPIDVKDEHFETLVHGSVTYAERAVKQSTPLVVVRPAPTRHRRARRPKPSRASAPAEPVSSPAVPVQHVAAPPQPPVTVEQTPITPARVEPEPVQSSGTPVTTRATHPAYPTDDFDPGVFFDDLRGARHS